MKLTIIADEIVWVKRVIIFCSMDTGPLSSVNSNLTTSKLSFSAII